MSIFTKKNQTKKPFQVDLFRIFNMWTLLDLKYTVLFIVTFIILALLVRYFPVNVVDISISNFTQQFHQPFLNRIMITISALGDVMVAFTLLMVTSLVFFASKYKREAIFVFSITATGAITFLLKRLFNRPRPTSDQVVLIDSYANHSFPSGHTLSYVVFFGFLIFLMRHLNQIPKYFRKTVSLFSWLMLILGPISRIYLGAHWFTDIVGGVIIGLLCLQALQFQYLKHLPK